MVARTTARVATAGRRLARVRADLGTAGSLAVLALVSALCLVPWIGTLAATLPTSYVVSNWTTTWVGFDLALMTALAATGIAALRRHPATQSLGVLTGTLLACDAWFDVSTASTGTDQLVSLAVAAVVELPLAAAMLWISQRGAAAVRSMRPAT